MRVYQMLLSESVENKDGRLEVSGVFPGYIILPAEPSAAHPVPLSFHLMVIFQGTMKETNETAKLLIIPPSKNNEQQHQMSLVQNEGMAHNANNLWAAIVNIDLRNYPFDETGEYTFLVSTKDSELKYLLTVTYSLPDVKPE